MISSFQTADGMAFHRGEPENQVKPHAYANRFLTTRTICHAITYSMSSSY